MISGQGEAPPAEEGAAWRGRFSSTHSQVSGADRGGLTKGMTHVLGEVVSSWVPRASRLAP